MKTAKVTINNTEYMVVFNNRVLKTMEDHGIKMSEISQDKPITQLMRLLWAMIDAGSRYAKINGMDYPTIDYELLLDLTDQNDYAAYQQLITECMAGERQVDAVPGKKTEKAEQAADPTN